MHITTEQRLKGLGKAGGDAAAFASAFALYAVFFLAFFLKSLVSGNYIAPSDSLDFGLPAFLSRPMLWTDGMYSGYPIAADPQSLTWYPVLAFMRLTGLGWNLFMVFPYVLASAGAYLLLRRMTGSNLAGAFSGLTYGLSGVLVGHIGHFNQVHAAAWVPLVFYGLQRIREGDHRLGAAIASLAYGLMWLAGHPQVAVYTAYVSAAAIAGGMLIDRPSRDAVLPRVGWSMVALAGGAALAAIAILPMIELGDFSRRAASKWEVYTSKPLPAWQLITLAFPNAFGGFWVSDEIQVPYAGDGSPVEMMGYAGLVAFTLAAISPFVLVRFRKEAALWMLVAVIAALLCLGAATPLAALFFYAPGYSSFRVPSRHLFVVAWCLAVASGLTFAEIVSLRERRRAVVIAAAVALAAASLTFALCLRLVPAVGALIDQDAYVRWAVVWPLALAGIAVCVIAVVALRSGSRAPLVASAVLLAVHLVDLVVFHYRWPGTHFEYADVPPDQLQLHPRMRALRDELLRTGQRVLAVDGSKNQFLLPNLTRPWGVPAASGTGSLGIERYLDVLGMGGPGDVYPEVLSGAQHQGVDLFAIAYALVPRDAALAGELRNQPGRWQPIEELRYYDHDPDTFYTLFRNTRAMPRAWCVSQALPASGDEALVAVRAGHLPRGAGPFDPSLVAMIDAGAQGVWRNASPPSRKPTVVANHRSGTHRYLVTTESPCLLVLGEVYYPWWRATVDDSPADLVRANHAMVAVPLGAGAHVVELSLTPLTVWSGAAISSVSCLAWAALVIPRRRKDRQR